MDNILDVGKVAEIFKTSEKTARKLLRENIRSKKIGKKYFTTLNNVFEFLEDKSPIDFEIE